jgi:hypothetical protein
LRAARRKTQRGAPARRGSISPRRRLAAGRNGNACSWAHHGGVKRIGSPAACSSRADPNATSCQPPAQVSPALHVGALRARSIQRPRYSSLPRFRGVTRLSSEARGLALRRERFGFSNFACRNPRRSSADSAPKKSTESHRHASSSGRRRKASDDGNRAGWGGRAKKETAFRRLA